MKFNLIQRKKVTHLGMKIFNCGKAYLVSVCNGCWNDTDVTRIGESSEITCKRCMKYAQEAEQNDGVVNLKPKKKG